MNVLSWILTNEQNAHGAAADTLHAAADSAAHGAAAAHGGEENLFTQLLHHIYDSRTLELPFYHNPDPTVHGLSLPAIHLFGIDLSVTKHVVFLWLAAVLLMVTLTLVARANAKRKVPTGLGNLVEVFVVFVRDEIVLANMGTGGLKYLPYLLTNFFFILVMNLLGLIPYGASATGNISVTAGLAVIAFFMIQIAAIRAQGFGHWLAHLTGGVHWALWPIMVPIEILGLFTKPFALCIRLFANMTGGHIVIVALIGLIFVFQSLAVAPVSVGFALAIYLLELFVAFLQAYIFTMLTSLFMGLGMQTESHGAEHQHGH
ncbi:MAG: F0F1 ATP synthase subunit A [Bacteroidetes bacterium]|nr:MAG: F0F1 ATP synthase subunit A [Bacteroidota bacterium]